MGGLIGINLVKSGHCFKIYAPENTWAQNALFIIYATSWNNENSGAYFLKTKAGNLGKTGLSLIGDNVAEIKIDSEKNYYIKSNFCKIREIIGRSNSLTILEISQTEYDNVNGTILTP